MLVVIGIIAVLIAITLPAIQKVRESSNRTMCTDNLRQLGIAIHNFHTAHSRFPSGTVACVDVPGFYNTMILPGNYGSPLKDGLFCSTIYVDILPYTEHSALFDPSTTTGTILGGKAYVSPRTLTVRGFMCPTRRPAALFGPMRDYLPLDSPKYSSYYGGVFLVWMYPMASGIYLDLPNATKYVSIFGHDSPVTLLDVSTHDGLGSTVLLAHEGPAGYDGPWYPAPGDRWQYIRNPVLPGGWSYVDSPHPSSHPMLTADGAVHLFDKKGFATTVSPWISILDNADPKPPLWRLASFNDGGTVVLPE